MLFGDAALFLLGFVLLLGGAEALVRGGSGLAKRFGISPLVIGLTIVAIGTSAPELVVSVTASAAGNGDVAIGNVVGSNIMNTLVVLGVTALVAPIAVQRRTIRADLPLVAAIGILVWLFASDGLLSRMEGFLLLAFVYPYLKHLFDSRTDTNYNTDEPMESVNRPWLAGVLVLGGVALLVWGGTLVVNSGTAMAQTLGISDRVIGLTLVAFGTSAPELATSLVAAARGKVDLAVGNVVGSNLLNLWLVLGSAAATNSIVVSSRTLFVDMPVMILGGLALLLFVSSKRLNRVEGGALVAMYAGYLGWVLAKA